MVQMEALPAAHVRNQRSVAVTASASRPRGCATATTTARTASTEGPAAMKPTAITRVVRISSGATTRTALLPSCVVMESKTVPMDQVNHPFPLVPAIEAPLIRMDSTVIQL